MDKYRNIRTLIRKNKTGEALNDLAQKNNIAAFQQKIIVLQAALSKLNDEKHLGIITKDYEAATTNKLNYSTLLLISSMEEEEANEPIWEEAVRCQKMIENSIVNLSSKIETLSKEMLTNDVINTLKYVAPKDYKNAIKIVAEKQETQNKPFLDKAKEELKKLTNANSSYKTNLNQLIEVLENKPAEISKAYIQHRHREGQIEFCKKQTGKYEVLYRQLTQKIIRNPSTLLFFVRSSLLIRYNKLQLEESSFNIHGYNSLNYNYFGFNEFGNNPMQESILNVELGIAEEFIETPEELNGDIDNNDVEGAEDSTLEEGSNTIDGELSEVDIEGGSTLWDIIKRFLGF